MLPPKSLLTWLISWIINPWSDHTPKVYQSISIHLQCLELYMSVIYMKLEGLKKKELTHAEKSYTSHTFGFCSDQSQGYPKYSFCTFFIAIFRFRVMIVRSCYLYDHEAWWETNWQISTWQVRGKKLTSLIKATKL